MFPVKKQQNKKPRSREVVMYSRNNFQQNIIPLKLKVPSVSMIYCFSSNGVRKNDKFKGCTIDTIYRELAGTSWCRFQRYYCEYFCTVWHNVYVLDFRNFKECKIIVYYVSSPQKILYKTKYYTESRDWTRSTFGTSPTPVYVRL